MTDDTYYKLRQLAIDMLNKGRADGNVSHEPDTFREQGYESQLSHAQQHLNFEVAIKRYGDIPDLLPGEDHLSHALTRILFAALLKQEQLEGSQEG